MAFLFKRNPKSPPDLVRSLNESLTKLDLSDPRKAQDDCHRYIRQVKVSFTGDDEIEPTPELCAALVAEIYALDCLVALVLVLKRLDFDLRKDVVTVFAALVRRRPGIDPHLAAEYLVHRRPEILAVLMRGPELPEVALVCGQILRDCARLEPVSRHILHSPQFWLLFKYAQSPTFEVATDTFVSLNHVLTTHKKLVLEFLARNSETFTATINGLIKSNNYVTKRQSVRLLTELVMQKLNQHFLMYYFDNTLSLKIIMMLLLDKLKNVQLEGFHVFKFFVAKPKKSQKITDILTKNKDNFIRFFDSFDVSDYGSAVVEERDYILHEIQKLPDIERIEPSDTAT